MCKAESILQDLQFLFEMLFCSYDSGTLDFAQMGWKIIHLTECYKKKPVLINLGPIGIEFLSAYKHFSCFYTLRKSILFELTFQAFDFVNKSSWKD